MLKKTKLALIFIVGLLPLTLHAMHRDNVTPEHTMHRDKITPENVWNSIKGYCANQRVMSGSSELQTRIETFRHSSGTHFTIPRLPVVTSDERLVFINIILVKTDNFDRSVDELNAAITMMSMVNARK